MIEILLKSGPYDFDTERKSGGLHPGDVVIRDDKSHFVTPEGNLIVWSQESRCFQELPATPREDDIILRLRK